MVHIEPDRPAFSTSLVFQLAESRGSSGPDIPRLHWPDECPSTNEALAAALRSDAAAWPDYSVFGTDFQSAGHARLDRTWQVPPRSCLTFSVPVRIPAALPAQAAGWLPLAAGAAVVAAVRAAGVHAGLKWPNDVLIDGRKLCGILCRIEMVGPQRVAIVGIGLNVHLRADELPVPSATSTDLAGATAGREHLLVAIVARLRAGLGELLGAADRIARGAVSPSDLQIGRDVADVMITVGKQVRVELAKGNALLGTAEGLGAGGELLVRGADGVTHSVSAGDVVHLRGADARSLP